LQVAPIGNLSASRPIYIKVKQNKPTVLSVVNAPISHPSTTDHFRGFYKLAGVDPNSAPKLYVDQATECQVSKKTPTRHDFELQVLPSPPYEGCIPPGFPQEA